MKKDISFIKQKTCTGCFACFSICPQQAIQMVSNIEGFLYPTVDYELCNNCGLCYNICPVTKSKRKKNKIDLNNTKIIAAKNLNEEERIQSSSGGIFSVLAKNILNENGIVFGALFNNQTEKIEHSYISSEKELYKLRGSKYIQSEIGNSFIQCKEFLKQGRNVLFAGTPCQVAGLKSYLREDYDNLFTVDFICYGVPSPSNLKILLDKSKKKIGNNKVENISFRDKRKGWNHSSLVINYANKEDVQDLHSTTFMKAFSRGLLSRQSCYDCQFKNGSNFSDITLGDCWGIEKKIPEFADNKGISILIFNNKKNDKIFNKENTSCYNINSDYLLKNNPLYFISCYKHSKRKFLNEFYSKGNYDKLEHHFENTFYEYFLKIIYRIKNFKIFILKSLK